jgi:hypothetical protein
MSQENVRTVPALIAALERVAENRGIETAAKRGKPRMIEYEDRRGCKHRRAERRLLARSINKTITRLGQILEVGVEREPIPRKPCESRRASAQAQG